MNDNADAVVALTIAFAAAAIGVVLVSPTSAYAESTAEFSTTFVSTSAELKNVVNSWGSPNS